MNLFSRFSNKARMHYQHWR